MVTVRKKQSEAQEPVQYVKCKGLKDAVLKALSRRDDPEQKAPKNFRFLTAKMESLMEGSQHYSYEVSEIGNGTVTFIMRKSSNSNVNGLDQTGYSLQYDAISEMDSMKSAVRAAALEYYTDPDTPTIKPQCIVKRHLINQDETEVIVHHPTKKHLKLGTVSWVKLEFKVSFQVTWPVGSLFDLNAVGGSKVAIYG